MYKEYWLPFEIILNPPDQILVDPYLSQLNLIVADYRVYKKVNFESNIIRLSSVIQEENRSINVPSYLFWPNKYTSKMIRINIKHDLFYSVEVFSFKYAILSFKKKTALPIKPFKFFFKTNKLNQKIFIQNTEFKLKTREQVYIYLDTDDAYFTLYNNHFLDTFIIKHLISYGNKKIKSHKHRYITISREFFFPIKYTIKLRRYRTSMFYSYYVTLSFVKFETINFDDIKVDFFVKITVSKDLKPLLQKGTFFILKD